MSYPSELSLDKNSDEWKLLSKHSGLLKELIGDLTDGAVVLDADLLFQGDQKKWEIFVDLFFPELGLKPLFRFKGNNLEVISNRGSKNNVGELMDYLLVNKPQTMWNFAEAQARKQLNQPQEVVNRERAVPRAAPVPAAAAAARNNDNYPNWIPNNNYYNNYNNNENNNRGPELGYTEEEENAMAHMQAKNVKRYFPKQGGKKKTRKSKHSKRKTRKHKN